MPGSGFDWRPGRVYFLTLLEPLSGTPPPPQLQALISYGSSSS